MSLSAFCMPWHATVSDAFEEILVKPLRGLLNISLTAWDEATDLPLRLFVRDPSRPLLFCQLPPPPELLRRSNARLIWLPMWDNVAKWPMSFWKCLPKSLRIIAFSEPVARLAKQFGLPTLHLRFFLDPDETQPVRVDGERTLLYWNRVGLYSFSALRRICRDLEIQKLIHICRPDPRYNHEHLALPGTIDLTRVITIRSFLPEEEHRRLLADCAFALAPRPAEGIGLAVLQSMARGACVLTYDGPAMNEYIVHGHSGFLFRSYPRCVHTWRKSILKRWSRWRRPQEPFFYHMVNAAQIGPDLKRIEPESIGKIAREEHKRGRAGWLENLEDYAAFIDQWVPS